MITEILLHCLECLYLIWAGRNQFPQAKLGFKTLGFQKPLNSPERNWLWKLGKFSGTAADELPGP